VINIFAAVTLVELMLTIGLGATIAELWNVARDWRGVVGAVVANYVAVPAAAVLLVLVLGAQPLVACGAMIVAVCPGAPFAPPFVAVARGRADRAVGLMVILAGSSAVLAPLLLQLLLPLVARGTGARVDAIGIVRTLALVQFLPLCVGLTVAARRPTLAQRLKKPLRTLSTLLNVALIGLILVIQFRMLAAIHTKGYVGMFALLGASAAAGWLLGGRDAADRRTLAITTSVRNVGVGLVIAGGSFPGTPAVTFTTAYALFQTVLTALAAVAVGRTLARPAAAGPPSPLAAPGNGPSPAPTPTS
jgi:BASS family bile acid:Na+ symporter